MGVIPIQLAAGPSMHCRLASLWPDSRTGRRGYRGKRAADTSAPSPGDFLQPELVHLLDTARRVIDQHVNDRGSCGACGSNWPCRRARLAEFTLGAL